MSYGDRMQRIPGVQSLTHANWFGGVYQDERNFIPQFAIDTPTYRQVFSEFKVPDDQWNAFVADREGAIVGASTAEKYHWKIGDRIPIRGVIFQGNWEFNIRGITRWTTTPATIRSSGFISRTSMSAGNTARERSAG